MQRGDTPSDISHSSVGVNMRRKDDESMSEIECMRDEDDL